MPQKYTVYFKQSRLVINKCRVTLPNLVKKKQSLTSITLKPIVQQFIENHEGKLKINLNVPYPKDTFEMLKNEFKFIKAAGGIVVNEKKEILMINRLAVWDLPKGKIETNESSKQAAAREVSEECNVPLPIILNKLPTTYHIYEMKGKWYLKQTDWYLMQGHYKWNIKPQIEESITAIAWMNEKEINAILNDTYPAISDLLQNFIKNKTKYIDRLIIND